MCYINGYNYNQSNDQSDSDHDWLAIGIPKMLQRKNLKMQH